MESRTEIFRRGVEKRLYRQSLPQWVGKLKGRGFYVIHKKYPESTPSVQKGVVGDIIISSVQVPTGGPRIMTSKFEELMLKGNRSKLIVKVNLYRPPFDVYKNKNSNHWGILGTGYLGTYSLTELYVTKHDAEEDLKKKTSPCIEIKSE